MYPQFMQLKRMGYICVKHSPWHWSVRRKDRPGISVEVWPTARKILKKYSPGPAPRFEGSLIQAVEREFGPVELEEEVITPARQGAIDLVQYYKENWPVLFKHTELFTEYLNAI